MLKTDLEIKKEIEDNNYSIEDMPMYISQLQNEAYNLGWNDGEQADNLTSDERNSKELRKEALSIEREKFQFAVDVLDEVMFDKWKAIDKRGSLIAEVHKLTPTIGPTLLDQ